MKPQNQPSRVRFPQNARQQAVAVAALFSAWMLALLFEGQILYALSSFFGISPEPMVFEGVAGHLVGLLLSGFFIRTKKAAKRLFIGSFLFFIVVSAAFFFPPSVLWHVGIITSSLLAGACVAAWGFYLKSSTPKNERIKTSADMLILSNSLMILLNMAAIHIRPHVGLALAMLLVLGSFGYALRLDERPDAAPSVPSRRMKHPVSIAKPLAFLCLFIGIITINSGLMYQVQGPAFAHLAWLTSWYWAIPYVTALFVMRNLPRKSNRGYILYVAIAMIGLSFIGFMCLGRSPGAYLVVNTLMMGACGVYDLFWWSILGEMLEFHQNPAKILGFGLSANVLGVLLGGLIGNAIVSSDRHSQNSTLLALTVVCVSMALLPILHKYLSGLLKDHAYLTAFSEMPPGEQSRITGRFGRFADLSEREGQVASLLLQKKTYKSIADELLISENTVKYYVKNIYSKFQVQSRSELIRMIFEDEEPAHPK